MWENFLSHPSWKNPDRPILPKSIGQLESPEKPLESEDLVQEKAIEEVVQGSHPIGEKLYDLFQGNFEVDKETKTNYHLLMDFEETEGVKFVLPFPNLTNKDVEKHLESKEKAKEKAKDLIPITPLPEIAQQAKAEIPTQGKPSLDLYEPYVQKTSKDQGKVKEEPAVILKAPLSIEKKEERIEIPKKEALIVNSEKIRSISRPDLTTQKKITEEPLQKKEAITREKNLFQTSETVKEQLAEGKIIEPKKPMKGVHFDGPILANYLMRIIMFDSFHYVKLNNFKKEPNFLLSRFIQKTKFNQALMDSNQQYGANYLFKSYFEITETGNQVFLSQLSQDKNIEIQENYSNLCKFREYVFKRNKEEIISRAGSAFLGTHWKGWDCGTFIYWFCIE